MDRENQTQRSEVLNTILHGEQRFTRTIEGVKDYAEKHPKVAVAAVVIGGLVLYEVYAHEYEKRTGKKLEGPGAMLHDVADRVEHDPDGIVGEARKAIDGVGNYIKGHKKLAVAVALLGPMILRQLNRNHEASVTPTQQVVTVRRS